jgi:DNA-binding response OmpR family regulator
MYRRLDPNADLPCALCGHDVGCHHRTSGYAMAVQTRIEQSNPAPLGEVARAGQVAVVDDDPLMRQLLREVLGNRGAQVVEYADGRSALAGMREHPPAAALIDLWLPGMDGYALCRALRDDSRTAGCALVIVTGSIEEDGDAFGAKVGADDFILKPFHIPSFVLRLASVLSRTSSATRTEAFERGGLVVDGPRGQTRLDGRLLALTPTGFAILYGLTAEPGRVRSPQDLLGKNLPADALSQVDKHVQAIKVCLGPARDRVQAISGVGYRFAA